MPFANLFILIQARSLVGYDLWLYSKTGAQTLVMCNVPLLTPMNVFDILVVQVKADTSTGVKILRLHNALEYCKKQLQRDKKSVGILICGEQNQRTEKDTRTIIEAKQPIIDNKT